jgi:hypothetical protein
MKQLILHIGTHKTGTTSIQKALADGRAWLQERGVTYPDGGPVFRAANPHHRWSRALTGAPGQDPADAIAYLDYVDSVASDRIIISTEAIYKHISGLAGFDIFQLPDYWQRRERYIDDLAALVRRYDARVVVWFREQESFARSLFGEMVAKGHWDGPFERFRDVYAVWFEYDRHLALFRQAFTNVASYSYDDDTRNGLIASFFSRIDVAVPPGSEQIWERRTPQSPAANLLLKRRN